MNPEINPTTVVEKEALANIDNQKAEVPVENVSIPSLEETFQSSEVNQTFNNTQLPDEKKEETSIISEIPQMSEEEFLNSLPDNNLPLSAIDNSEKNTFCDFCFGRYYYLFHYMEHIMIKIKNYKGFFRILSEKSVKYFLCFS